MREFTYLIHLTTPIAHAGHYLGACSNLRRRLTEHATGSGARILQVALERGIEWRLARLWQHEEPTEGFKAESQWKKHRNGKSLCPLCNIHAKTPRNWKPAEFPVGLLTIPITSEGLRNASHTHGSGNVMEERQGRNSNGCELPSQDH